MLVWTHPGGSSRPDSHLDRTQREGRVGLRSLLRQKPDARKFPVLREGRTWAIRSAFQSLGWREWGGQVQRVGRFGKSLLRIGDPFPRQGDMRLLHLADVRLEHLVSPDGVTTLKLHSPAVLGAQAGFNDKDLLARDELDVSPSGAGLVPLLTATDGGRFVPARDFQGRLSDVPAPIIVFYRTGRLFARNSSPTAPSNFKQGAREQAFEFWWDAGVRSEYLREWFKTQTLVDLQHLLRSRANGFSDETQKQVRLLPLVARAIATAVQQTRIINFDADRDDIVVEFDDGIRSRFLDNERRATCFHWFDRGSR